MGKRLIPIVALFICLVPSVTMALGLGPITMRSALNQPLLAEIDIHSLQPGDLDSLAVRLASDEDFKRVNVERAGYLTQIKFKVAFRSDGSAYIQLSTDQPVTEPYLDFLVEARWARGRALKEYTVLVDPPVLTAETPAPVEQVATTPVFTPPKPAPQARQPAPASRPAPRPQTQPRAKPKPAPRQMATGPAGPLNYGVVKRNDTLWEIADDLKQQSGTDASIHQIMMALLRANPDAFINNNVNQVKAGYVLRIDDESMLADMSRNEAVQEFRRQTRQWQARRSGRLVEQVEVADAGEAAAPSTGSGVEVAGADQAQLKLVAPGREGQGTGGSKDSAEVQQLQDDLILATEALDTSRQESEDLKTRLGELEEQLESMQRLIMLKDEELLAIQNQAAKQPEAAAIPPKEQPAADKPTPAAEAEADTGSFSDYILFGVALLAIIGVVAWLVIRRKKMQEGFEESILNVGMGSAAAASAATFGASAPADSGASSMVSDFAMSDIGGIQSDSAEVDPISEADVYLAYGRHQQAEDIIKQAIETNPQRLELHSKLLEVYHAANNRQGFEQHAQVLHDQIGGDESNEYWQRISGLGAEICPDNPLFGGTLMPSAGEQVAGNIGGVTAEEEDLLDFEFGDSESTVMAPAAADDDNILDFDVSGLDFSLDDELEEDKRASVDSMDDNSLDFDMAFDESNDTGTAMSVDDEPTAMNMNVDAETKEINLGSIDFDTAMASSEPAPAATEELASEMDLSLEDFDSEDTLHAAGGELEMDTGFAESTDFGMESADLALEGLGEDEDLDDDIFADVDEIGTKLDLAKAYVDMGDSDGARSILDEVMEEGDDTQKEQAQELLRQMG